MVLVVACFMTPYSIAFPELEGPEQKGQLFVFNNNWTIIESIVDMVFLVEIIVCLNSSYYEQ